MSLNEKMDGQRNEVLWAHRKRFGRGPDHPRDRWALRQMLNEGAISAAQFDAADVLDKWHQGSIIGGASGVAERVDGGLQDYHAAPRLRELNSLRYNVTMSFLHNHMRTSKQRDIIWNAWRFPHPTLADLAYIYHPAGGNRDRVVATLQKACDLLVIRLKDAADDIFAWDFRRSLDQVYEAAHTDNQRVQVRP